MAGFQPWAGVVRRGRRRVGGREGCEEDARAIEDENEDDGAWRRKDVPPLQGGVGFGVCFLGLHPRLE